MQELSHNELWLRIAPSNRRHYGTACFRIEDIRHYLEITGMSANASQNRDCQDESPHGDGRVGRRGVPIPERSTLRYSFEAMVPTFLTS